MTYKSLTANKMAERRYSVFCLISSVVGEKGATNYDAIVPLG